jgi:small-conductance mechanosensitive channel
MEQIPAIAENLQALFASHPQLMPALIKTAILIVLVQVLRFIMSRYINGLQKITAEDRLKWLVAMRNFTVIAMVLGIFFIWVYQIREFALSVVALAIAFVMCFKEVISNFMGGVSRAVSHEFTVGDRISVSGFRGDVIDTSMLTTTILEIGPGKNAHQYTGNTVVVPNAMLLNTPVLNESFLQGYELHLFHIPMRLADDWRRAERLLLEAAYAVTEPYLNKARIFIEAKCRKLSVEPPSVDPRTSIIFTKPDEFDMIVRIPVPLRRKGRVEQEIIRKYLDLLSEEN